MHNMAERESVYIKSKSIPGVAVASYFCELFWNFLSSYVQFNAIASSSKVWVSVWVTMC